MFKVMIDPGHGGKDVGASNKYAKEKDINLTIAKACKEFLKDYPEVKVEMTRYTDTEVALETRGKISNLFQANLFISIHNNAGGGDGFEVYHYTGSVQGNKMAKLLAEEFTKIGQNKRFVGSGLYAGTKPGNYTVLEVTHAPAVLGEFGFMDTKDYTQFDEQHEIKEIGHAYAKAALRYFGIPLKTIPNVIVIEKPNLVEVLTTHVEVLEKEIKHIKDCLKNM